MRWLAAMGLALAIVIPAAAEEAAAPADPATAKGGMETAPTWQHGLTKPVTGPIETAAPPGTPEEAAQERRWQHGLSPIEQLSTESPQRRRRVRRVKPAGDGKPLRSIEHSRPVSTSDPSARLSSEEGSEKEKPAGKPDAQGAPAAAKAPPAPAP